MFTNNGGWRAPNNGISHFPSWRVRWNIELKQTIALSAARILQSFRWYLYHKAGHADPDCLRVVDLNVNHHNVLLHVVGSFIYYSWRKWKIDDQILHLKFENVDPF